MERLTALKNAVKQAKAENPNFRNLDIAQHLGISEATLVSLFLGETATLLTGDFKNLLKGIEKMGYVMALTRNAHAVHERKGVYQNIEFYGGAANMGVAVNPDIDLRFFMNEWQYALAVEMPRGNDRLYSFQFFNKKGEAVHKIFSTPKSDIAAYHELVAEFRAEVQQPLLDVDTTPYTVAEPLADAEIDVEGFQETWRNLQDTHDFFGMLRKYKVTRTQGLRLAPEGFTQRIDNEAVVRMLEGAAEREVSIMCFLHSRGIVQIHTGKVKNLKFFGDWFNVLDPKFNLHLNTKSIAETWIVQKPTADGIVTSLEIFDKDSTMITYFFGERKPGKPELAEWRELVQAIQLVTA